jgi:hypothetical protein
VTGVLALAGYGAAGLLVSVCVVATLPRRPIAVWGITGLLGAVAGLIGGVAGGMVLDIHPTRFFCADAWAPAIGAAAILLSLWRTVAPPPE